MKTFGEVFALEESVPFSNLKIVAAQFFPVASKIVEKVDNGTPQGKRISHPCAMPGVLFLTKDKDGNDAKSITVICRTGGNTISYLRKTAEDVEYLHDICSYGWSAGRNGEQGRNKFKPGYNDAGQPYGITLATASPIFMLTGDLLDDEDGRNFKAWCASPEALEMGKSNRGVDEGISKLMGTMSDFTANMRRCMPLGGGTDRYLEAAESRANGTDGLGTAFEADETLNPTRIPF